MANNQGIHDVSLLSKDFHVWPDFHGNRSPLADPTMKGMIVGLTVNNSEENLAILYLATMQALSVRNCTLNNVFFYSYILMFYLKGYINILYICFWFIFSMEQDIL